MKKLIYSMSLVVIGAQASEEVVMIRPVMTNSSNIEEGRMTLDGHEFRYMPIAMKQANVGMVDASEVAVRFSDSNTDSVEADVLDEDDYEDFDEDDAMEDDQE